MDKETKAEIERIEKRLEALEKLYIGSGQQQSPKVMSIKEYMLEKKPNGDVEKTLVIGAFLEKQQNMGSFTIEDLRKGFEAAKEPVPDNISDKIYKNIKKGHMMEASSKKGTTTAYILTSTGEKYINSIGQGEPQK